MVSLFGSWVLTMKMTSACFGFSIGQNTDAPPVPLPDIYSNIRDKAISLSDWPHSRKFRENLSRNSRGKLCPPDFYDGHGPIGVIAMLHRNQDARFILKNCGEAFCSFREEIKRNILKPSQWQDMEDLIFQPCETSFHICVSIFHEHPSLLHLEEDKLNWRPIDATQRAALEDKLSKYQSTHCYTPCLKLDSILWTPDGAMIAGFVDTSSGAAGYYKHVQSSSADIAKATLGGELTTRPKSLIHVTIGRVLGLPDDASEEQRKDMTKLMRSYNQHILPAIVQSIKSSTTKGCFRLKEVSLVRNRVWLMKEYIEYASWPLSSTRDKEETQQNP